MFGTLFLGGALLITPCHAQEFQLQTLTLETQTGSNLGSNSNSVGMADFFKAQKQAVYHILQQVGVDPESLPPDIRSAIDEPQTTSYKALEAFSNGLDQLDKEQFDAAKGFFEQAVELDPGFRLAEGLRDAMPEVNQTIQGSVNTAMSQAQTKAVAIVGKADKSSEEGAKSASKEGEATAKEGDTVAEEGRESDAGGGSELSTGGGEGESVGKSATVIGGEVGESPVIVSNVGVLPVGLDVGDAQTDAVESHTTKKISSASSATLTQANSGAGAVGYLTAYSSKPATTDRLGYFVVQFLKKLGSNWAEVIKDPYIGSSSIPEEGLERLTVFKERLLDVEKTGLDNQLNRKVSFSDDGLETGHYEILPAYVNAPCEKGSSKTCQYYADRLFFAEGTPTSAATLSQLASDNAQYTYTGAAGSVVLDIEKRTSTIPGSLTSSTSGAFESTNQGTFRADIHFGATSNQVRNVNINALTDSFAVKIQNGQADLKADGSFQFSQSGTLFQVGTQADVGALNAAATNGQVSGQTFGSKSVGGVLYMERDVGDNEKWLASGSFRGSR